jgi:site-specific DNA recombinase
MTKRAAIYVRISKDDTDDAAGVRRQEEDCRRLALERGFDVVEVYRDNDVSAYSRRPRPEFERLMADVAAGELDAIVAWATDRLYRRTTDLDRLVDAIGGVEVATVKSGDVDLSNADGKLRARILADVAQHESEKKGERITRALQQRAEQGGHPTGVRRYGYTASGAHLVPDEAAVLADAYRRILTGESLGSIVRDLNTRGVPSAHGKEWSGKALKRALLRPMNAGRTVYRGKVAGRGSWETIVDEDTFDAVAAILRDPRRGPKVGRPPVGLLSPVLYCERCGSKMHHRYRHIRGHRVPIYTCPKYHTQRQRDVLDRYVVEQVLDRLDALARRGRIAPPARATARDKDTALADQLGTRLDNLASLYADGTLDPEDFAAATRKVREQLRDVEERLARRANVAHAHRLAATGDVRNAWQALTLTAQHAILREVLARVVVGPVSNAGSHIPALEPVALEWAVA